MQMRGGRKILGGGMEDYFKGASDWVGDMTKRAKHAAGYQEDTSLIIPDYTAPMTESTEPMAGPMAEPMAESMADPMAGPMGGRRSRKSRKSRKHATKGKKRKSKRRGKRSRRTRRGRR